MSSSYKVSYVGDGTTTNYAVVPDYIRKNHIFVTLDGVSTSAYTFFNDQTIQFNTAPGLGVVIEIVRRPPGDIPLNTFTGTVITPTALNENFRQSTQLGTIFQDDAETAIAIASSAAAAVASAVLYKPVIDLAALALLAPADGEFFELQDSTGAESDLLITGVPVGLVGDLNLSFRLRYDDPPGEYVFIEYFSTDPESRYIRTGIEAIVNADVNASAGIVATKLAFTQAGSGAVQRTVDSKLKDVVSAKDFGAVGDGVADDTAAIQAAIDYAAGKAVLIIPEGVWIVSAALRWHTNSYIRGAGVGLTVIKLSDSAAEDSNILEPDLKDGSIVDWGICDLTLDGNYNRPTVSGVGIERPGASCLATMGASHGNIERVHARDAVLHGIDICNGGEVVSGRRYYCAPANRGPTYYPANESTYIWIDEVSAENCGDDAITGHYSRYIQVGKIFGQSTGGRHPNPNAGNAVELDDGTRDWNIAQSVSIGGNRGFVIKTHDPEPAPTNISVGTVQVSEARTGVYINSNPSDVTAKTNIHIGQITTINPSENNTASSVPFRAVDIRHTSHASIGSIIVKASGTESFNLATGVLVGNSSSDINIGELLITNWPYNNISDTELAGFRTTSTCANISVNRLVTDNCGFQGVLNTGTPNNFYGSIVTILPSAITNSVGLRISVSPQTLQNYVGAVRSIGYETPVIYGTTSFPKETSFINSGQWVDGFITAGNRNNYISTRHQLNSNSAPNNSDIVVNFSINNTENSVQIFSRGAGGGFAANSAASVMKVGFSETTSRSISTGGTINASGADYAEYEYNNELTIAKGSIVGFKSDGTLTLTYAEAIRFGVKSTNPSYVGGDTWGSEEVVGLRPEHPVRKADVVTNIDDAEVVLEAGETDAEWDARKEMYAQDLAVFEAAYEAARSSVDRIAYSGKVPVNVFGASPGDYVIAVPNTDGSIGSQCVAEPAYNQYLKCIGRVNRILDDGRAEVAILVH